MDFKQNSISRREFMHAAAIGSAVLAAGPVFEIVGKETPKAAAPASIFVCSVCGHVEFGNAPEFCPICHAPKEKFDLNNNVFSEAQATYKDAAISHTPVIIVNKQSTLISETPTYEVQVRIGKKLHPMEEQHHIRFIDCYVDDKYFARMILTIGSSPAATFYTKAAGATVRAVEVCTVHGHWQAETGIK
jgi:desulfoferrodoxin-like iron-binding protein